MKTALIFALLLTFVSGSLQIAEAKTQELQKIQINKQKKFAKSNLSVKFVSLMEDSRCPVGTDCIWAGNAKIKIEVTRGKIKEIFELNTNLGARGASFEGFSIELVNLIPVPRKDMSINKNQYTAEISVSRLTR